MLPSPHKALQSPAENNAGAYMQAADTTPAVMPQAVVIPDLRRLLDAVTKAVVTHVREGVRRGDGVQSGHVFANGPIQAPRGWKAEIDGHGADQALSFCQAGGTHLHLMRLSALPQVVIQAVMMISHLEHEIERLRAPMPQPAAGNVAAADARPDPAPPSVEAGGEPILWPCPACQSRSLTVTKSAKDGQEYWSCAACGNHGPAAREDGHAYPVTV